MRRKISVNDLEVEMYVTDLDRPWTQAPFEPPFEFRGFAVSSHEELDKVKKLCEYVYIDPNFGKEAKNYLPDTYGLKDITQVFVSLSSSTKDKLTREETSLEQEIPVARKSLQAANEIYIQVVDDIRERNAISEGALQSAITALVNSIGRNPAALTWLTAQQSESTFGYVSPISITALAITVGRALRLPQESMESLAIATLFQDIGMLTMPGDIVNKKSPLTTEEMDVLKGHVDASVKLLERSGNFSSEIIQTVQQHHERSDGSGYPRGLSGDYITTLSAIAGISDSYQSATADRPYRKGKTSFQTLMELYSDRGNNFDSSVVEQFIQCTGIFPVGSFVELNTHEIAVVVSRHPEHQLKPTVKIVVNAEGERLEEPAIIDLANPGLGNATNRLVTKVIDPEEKNLDVGGVLA
jgi:HD-GYP domain-containing protein (c-di-GMP phosphodiesterase class II)